MLSKPIDQITADDLLALIGSAREGKMLEFKRELPRDHAKLAAAVSAFANTLGGDLLIGVYAKDGLVAEVAGIPVDPDKETLRIQQVLSSQLEPRVPGVHVRFVHLGSGQAVGIVRTPRSWLAPHRVTLNDRFYLRRSAGNEPMDVDELRSAFTLSTSVAERIRSFRSERIAKIATGEGPMMFSNRAAMVIHSIPFSAVALATASDIVQEIKDGNVLPLPPGRLGRHNQSTPNLDGLLIAGDARDAVPAYSQIFRTGIVEGAHSAGFDEAQKYPYFFAPNFEKTVTATVGNYRDFGISIERGFPLFIFVSFIGMRVCRFRVPLTIQGQAYGHNDKGPLSQDTVMLPEAMIESERTDIPAALRLTLNSFWNGFGMTGPNDPRGQL